jgi:hypothetical protein
MDTIILQEAKCILRFGTYYNNTIAIEAFKASTKELWTVPTVNFEQGYGPGYAKNFSFPFVVIKNYGELSGVYEELESQGVVYMGIPISNNINIQVIAALLTDKWEEIAKKQLKIP